MLPSKLTSPLHVPLSPGIRVADQLLRDGAGKHSFSPGTLQRPEGGESPSEEESICDTLSSCREVPCDHTDVWPLLAPGFYRMSLMLKHETPFRLNYAMLMMPAGKSGWVRQQPMEGPSTESWIEKNWEQQFNYNYYLPHAINT